MSDFTDHINLAKEVFTHGEDVGFTPETWRTLIDFPDLFRAVATLVNVQGKSLKEKIVLAESPVK
ncbi:MAG: hypothetical protein WCG73_00540 [Candidatus Moraniibacteriota bacterium]